VGGQQDQPGDRKSLIVGAAAGHPTGAAPYGELIIYEDAICQGDEVGMEFDELRRKTCWVSVAIPVTPFERARPARRSPAYAGVLTRLVDGWHRGGPTAQRQPPASFYALFRRPRRAAPSS